MAILSCDHLWSFIERNRPGEAAFGFETGDEEYLFHCRHCLAFTVVSSDSVVWVDQERTS